MSDEFKKNARGEYVVMGKTAREWHEDIREAEYKRRELRDQKHLAMENANAEKIRAIEEEISILGGSILAAKQILMAEPFNEDFQESDHPIIG